MQDAVEIVEDDPSGRPLPSTWPGVRASSRFNRNRTSSTIAFAWRSLPAVQITRKSV